MSTQPTNTIPSSDSTNNSDSNVDDITSQKQRVTPETPWKPLTRKQKVFADELLNNPKQSATQAALKAYNTTPATASVIATENLRKPSIQAYMESQGKLASQTAIQLLQHSAKVAVKTDKKNDRGSLGWARLAWDISEGINDRIHGKPVTKAENSNLNVSIQSVLD